MAAVLDAIVCPVGVPHIFGVFICVLDATCASSLSVWEVHPESMAESWGLFTSMAEITGGVNSTKFFKIVLPPCHCVKGGKR